MDFVTHTTISNQQLLITIKYKKKSMREIESPETQQANIRTEGEEIRATHHISVRASNRISESAWILLQESQSRIPLTRATLKNQTLLPPICSFTRRTATSMAMRKKRKMSSISLLMCRLASPKTKISNNNNNS